MAKRLYSGFYDKAGNKFITATLFLDTSDLREIAHLPELLELSIALEKSSDGDIFFQDEEPFVVDPEDDFPHVEASFADMGILPILIYAGPKFDNASNASRKSRIGSNEYYAYIGGGGVTTLSRAV